MTAEIAASIIATYAEQADDRPIDYQHQLQKAAENGKPVPAAAWFHRLEWRADGLWATDVRWTDPAAAAIRAGEYRYVSPVFTYDDDTGAVSGLLCASLVAIPGLDGLTDLRPDLAKTAALAALIDDPARLAALTLQGNPVDESLLERLRYLLNLPVTSTATDIAEHLGRLIEQIQGGSPEMAAVGLDLPALLSSQAGRIAVLEGRLAADPDPEKWVALAAHRDLEQRLRSAEQEVVRMRQAALEAEVDAVLELAVEAGRLLPAQVSAARQLALANREALDELLSAQPIVEALQGMQSGGRAPSGTEGRTPFEIAQLAREYQARVEALGSRLPYEAAVAHVMKQ